MTDLAPYAGGVTATLTCDGDEVSPLAWTHQNVLVWSKLDGTMDAVKIPLLAQPLVVAAPLPAGGTILVAPRSLAQLPVHTEYMSDKPVLNLGQLDAAEEAARSVFAHFSRLTRGLDEHPLRGCHVAAESGLIEAVAEGFEPLGDGPVVAALYPPSVRPVPAAALRLLRRLQRGTHAHAVTDSSSLRCGEDGAGAWSAQLRLSQHSDQSNAPVRGRAAHRV